MDITFKEVERRQNEVFQQKARHEAAKLQASEEHKELQRLQMEHIALLQSLEVTSHKSSDGVFSFSYQENYKMDQPNKEQFYEHLREKGIFNSMITVDSRKLNSWAKIEVTNAAEEGNYDYNIPGLTKSEPWARPSMTKK